MFRCKSSPREDEEQSIFQHVQTDYMVTYVPLLVGQMRDEEAGKVTHLLQRCQTPFCRISQIKVLIVIQGLVLQH